MMGLVSLQEEKETRTHSLSEDTGRRWLSASQEEGSRQESTMLAS